MKALKLNKNTFFRLLSQYYKWPKILILNQNADDQQILKLNFN